MGKLDFKLARAGGAVLVCLGLLLAAAGSSAQSSGDSQTTDITKNVLPMESVRSTRFHFLDLNGDGYISRSEVPPDEYVLGSQFQSLDSNKDGRLDLQEFSALGR